MNDPQPIYEIYLVKAGRACQDATDYLGRLGHKEREAMEADRLRGLLREIEDHIWRTKFDWYGDGR